MGSIRSTRLAQWSWLLLPLACHFGYSWIGFTPTDDGWMLAIARRLIDGQIPYRDFIFVFPPLSAILEIPLVLFGGDYVLWLSRLWGWITIGAVCWLWSGRVDLPGNSFSTRYALYACACLMTAHTFPVMAWHSLDGMLLISLAVCLAGRNTPNSLRTAFFLTGLAALCRQNFAIFPPFLLLAIHNPFKWRAMFWTGVPPLIFAATTLYEGCLSDCLRQVTSTGDHFAKVAFWQFIKNPGFLWAIPAGAVSALLIQAGRRRLNTAAVPAIVVLCGLTYTAFSLWRGPYFYADFAFQFFGFVLGLTLVAAGRGLPDKDRLILAAGLGLTWVTSISIGYNTPMLMTGVLLCLLWHLVHLLDSMRETDLNPKGNLTTAALFISVLTIGAAFQHARQQFPYRDRPAAELQWDVGDVLPGGAGLRTNSLTYATLADLKQLTTRFEAEHRRYAIFTDCSAFWIRSTPSNPLICEWAQETALGYDLLLFQRFFESLKKLPPESPIIVQKYLIAEYSWSRMPVPAGAKFYFAQEWVQKFYHKTGETEFFEIYVAPTAP